MKTRGDTLYTRLMNTQNAPKTLQPYNLRILILIHMQTFDSPTSFKYLIWELAT